MVSVVVFPTEGVLVRESRALGIVTRKFISFVSVHILVMALEVGWTPKYLHLSVTSAWILAREFILLVAPILQIRIITVKQLLRNLRRWIQINSSWGLAGRCVFG